MQNPEELQQHLLTIQQQQLPSQQQQQQQSNQGGLTLQMDSNQVRDMQLNLPQSNQLAQANQQFKQVLSTSSSSTFPVNEADIQHKNGNQLSLDQQKMIVHNSQMNGDQTHIQVAPVGQVSSQENNQNVIQQQSMQQLQQQQSESLDQSDDNGEDGDDDDDEDGDDISGKGGANKKKYQVISQDIREKFIQKVISKQVTIKEAAKEFGLKFSTSKAILQTFKKEGRIGKKKTRQRKPRLVKKMIINTDPITNQVTPQIFYTTTTDSQMASKSQTNIMSANPVAALLANAQQNQPHLAQYILKNNQMQNLHYQNQTLNGSNPQALIDAQLFQQKAQQMFNNQMYPQQQGASAQQQAQLQQLNLNQSIISQQNQQQQQQNQQAAAVAAAAIAQLGGQQQPFSAATTPLLTPLLGSNDLLNNYMLNQSFSLNGPSNQSQNQQNSKIAADQLQNFSLSQQQQSPTQITNGQLNNSLLNGVNGINNQYNYQQGQQSQQQAFPLQQNLNSLFPPTSPFLSAQQAPPLNQQQQLNQILNQQSNYPFPISKGSADFSQFLNLNSLSQPNQGSGSSQQLNQLFGNQGSQQGFDMQLNQTKTESNGLNQPNRSNSNGLTMGDSKEKNSQDDQKVNGANNSTNPSSAQQLLINELAEISQQFQKQKYTHQFPTTTDSSSYSMTLPTNSATNTNNNSNNSSANRASQFASIQFFGSQGGRNESGSVDSVNGNALNLQLLGGQQSLENNPLFQNKLSTDSLNFNLFGFPSIDMASQIPYLFNNTTTQGAQSQLFSQQIHKNSIF